jgi:hypothetical protein
MKAWIRQGCFLGLILFGDYGMARANERHFAYTYESATLPAGVKEIEPWMTWRAGRDQFYSALDYRMEYEVGLTDRLQTSLYFNWHQTTLADPAHPGQKIDDQGFDGVSSEWKYKLLDPVADVVGLALYQEYTFKSDELEWESKLILDKKIGNNLIAYNAVIEPDWDFGPGNTNYTLNLENDLGVVHFFAPVFSAGLEVHNQNEKLRSSPGLQNSAFFIGPVATYAHETWWVTLAILRQLPALKRSVDNPNDTLVLDTQEKFNVRLLGSIRI